MKPVVILAALIMGAAQPPAIDDPEAKISKALVGETVVEGVDVRPGGPAWWQVSDGDRTVYVLGVLWDFPAGKGWDKTRLNARLRNSDILLIPPSFVTVLPPPRKDAAALRAIPDQYEARIRSAARRLYHPAERYLKMSPLLAGTQMATDFRDIQDLNSGPQLSGVRLSAGSRRVPEQVTGAMIGAPRQWTSPTASEAAGLACLDAALAEIEGGPAPLRAAAEAWTKGDVVGALSGPRAFDICTYAIPADVELRRTAQRMEADAIARVLRGQPRPQKAIAVIELRSLVTEGGVLDRLRAQGFTVRTPSGAEALGR